MTTLAHLHRAVEQTIAEKRLGTPVFVRYRLQSRDKANAVVTRLARITDTVRQWLDQPIDRLYALGPIKSGHVALTIECRQGATALISWSQSSPQGDGVDLMVIGNQGVIYHDAGAAPLWDEAAAPLAERPNADTVTLIQRALRTGRPESAGKGGDS